jgi:hypothetical protein
MAYTWLGCGVEEAMSYVTTKRENRINKMKLKNLQLSIVLAVIDGRKLLRNQYNWHLSQLSDRSMISLGTVMMVMPIHQYSQ